VCSSDLETKVKNGTLIVTGFSALTPLVSVRKLCESDDLVSGARLNRLERM